MTETDAERKNQLFTAKLFRSDTRQFGGNLLSPFKLRVVRRIAGLFM
jgi:hypothetical protein